MPVVCQWVQPPALAPGSSHTGLSFVGGVLAHCYAPAPSGPPTPYLQAFSSKARSLPMLPLLPLPDQAEQAAVGLGVRQEGGPRPRRLHILDEQIAISLPADV